MDNETVKSEPVVSTQPTQEPQVFEASSQTTDTTTTTQGESSTSVTATVNTEVNQEQHKRTVLDDLKRERARRRELQAEIQALREQVQSISSNTQTNSVVSEVARELGIDEESAKKFVNVTQKLTGNKPQTNQVTVEEQRLVEGFKNQVEEVREEYPDWDVMSNAMQNKFMEDYHKNPMLALQRGPEFYYLKAKSSQTKSVQSALKQGQEEMAQRINNKNISSVESSRNGNVKPVAPSKWTREKIASMSVDEYRRNRAEIEMAMNRGEIK